jgi:hypothetical protein
LAAERRGIYGHIKKTRPLQFLSDRLIIIPAYESRQPESPAKASLTLRSSKNKLSIGIDRRRAVVGMARNQANHR